MSEQITPADALQTLANASAQYRGTLQEHQVIQQCVQVLRENNEALERIKAEQKSEADAIKAAASQAEDQLCQDQPPEPHWDTRA